MDHEIPSDRIRIAAYVAGGGSREERAAVEAWIAVDAGRVRELAALERLWSAIPAACEVPDDVATLWKRVEANIGSRLVPETRTQRTRVPGDVNTRRNFVRIVLGAAAAVAVVWTATEVVTRSRAVAPMTHVYSTQARQQATLALSNARVTLAPRTTLRVTGTTVDLDGQAFFEVTGRAGTPFIVRTGDVVTRVLGTAFDVRRYRGETTTRVIVVEGKVAVSTNHPVTRAATLTAGAVAHVRDSTIMVNRTTDPAELTSWTNGRLVFQNASVGEVLATMERWYGVTFQIKDSVLKAKRLTTTLDTRRARSQTLSVLASVLEVDMTTVGDTITLVPQVSHVRRVLPRKNTLFTPSPGAGR